MLAELTDGEAHIVTTEMCIFLWIVGGMLVFTVGFFIHGYIKHGGDDDVGPMPF